MSATQPQRPEAGLRDHRVDFVREEAFGDPGSDPDFLKYSTTIYELTWTPNSVVEPQMGIGSPDPSTFLKGPETHEVTVAYDLVKFLSQVLDPSSSSTLGVQSTDSGDTDVDVTIKSLDESTQETITTDGTDGTTFTTGSTSFDSVYSVEIDSAASGDIEVYTDDSGSPGNKLATLESGDTSVEAPDDASFDGLQRDRDNLLPNSHTLVDREDKGSIDQDSTVSGNSDRDTRIYKVGKGGQVDEVSIVGDPSDAQPITVELSYLFQKVRSYQIDQPDGDSLLYVKSDDSDDDSQSVKLEDEGANTTETVSLNGTTAVSTSNQFGDIDAAELTAETEGDITIGVNTGSETSPTEGDALMVIKGKDSYDGVEGDLGVPVVDSGSRETTSSLGSYEQFIGDRILRASSPFPHEIPAATIEVANNVEETEQSSTYGMALHPGNRELTLVTTVFGESATYHNLIDHLTADTNDLTWEMDGGDVVLEGCALTEPGDITAEEGGAVMSVENTFRAQGLSIQFRA